MADTPSGTHMNWTNVYYEVNSLVYTILDVVDMHVERGAQPRFHRGPGKFFAQLMTVPIYTRAIRVVSTNVASMANVPMNQRGTVSGIFNDPVNGAGLGAIVIYMFNASLLINPFSGRQNEFGGGSLLFHAISSDGTTDPLVITETL